MEHRFLYTSFLLIFFLAFHSYAQETEKIEETLQDDNSVQDEEPLKRHFISASINHTIIFSAVKNGEHHSNLNVPSFGLNYTYALSEKWGIGLHNDIILEDFIVKGESLNNDGTKSPGEEIETIERETPISMALVAVYKPIENLGIVAGGGMEFSKNEHYALVRFGLEAPFELQNSWEIYGVLSYDIMFDAYTSLSYGIGIVKQF
jgi:hypothetical protein